MEDVVLHYRPGSALGLSALVERTERLLKAFPLRPSPVFTPWFPSAAGGPLPIRPARPPPVISGWSESWTCTAQSGRDKPGERCAGKSTDAAEPQLEEPQELPTLRPERLPPAVLPSSGQPQTTRTSSDGRGISVAGSPVRRSWSVFKQRGVLLRKSQPLSKHFRHMVTVHRLHLQQRVKWVIGQHNCGTSRDIEQVWQTVSRSVRSARLPTCNANIQRERAEIWVFCDVLHSEQVGRSLKDELQLSGTIRLSHHRRGDIFSM